jgi:uncharacterized protein (UPF0548 family)
MLLAPSDLGPWLARQEAAPLPVAPARDRLTVDHHRVVLGRGPDVYRLACEAVRRWEMFRVGWVTLVPAAPAIRRGTTVGVVVRHFGFRSANACRIVALIDEAGADATRFGFVYRTLPDHAVEGEERFLVDWTAADDAVAYDLTAWSRPRHLLARLGRPLARRVQRRFARDSLAAMVRAARQAPSSARSTNQ